MGELIRRYTVDQWKAIDDEYRDPTATRGEAAWVLVVAAVALALGRYYGSESFIAKMPSARAVFRELPAPGLYPWLYWSGFKLVSYGLLPALCIRLALKRKITDHGLRLVHEPPVWFLYGALLLLALPAAYFASQTASFLATYPKYRGAGESWQQFLAWEVAYGFQFLMLEFFFRGFLTFSLARHMGALAIFVTIVPYSMIHYGKPLAECLGSILAGIVLGTIALRTRSIYGGVAVHCGVAWAMDLFALSNSGAMFK